MILNCWISHGKTVTSTVSQAGARRRASSRRTNAKRNPAWPSAFCVGSADRALALELRFADGNSDWLSYSCLVSGRFNPSAGLLLKFTADEVTLVLIRGSNLDALVNGAVDLPHAIQRHRIIWIREMDKAEINKVGRSGPTIDRIEVGECESQEEVREWLSKASPVFARRGTS